jgi:hypothetical protein
MGFRIATAPNGERLWWADWETIPPTHTGIRPATEPEARLMASIIRQDSEGRGGPSEATAARLRQLLAADERHFRLSAT